MSRNTYWPKAGELFTLLGLGSQDAYLYDLAVLSKGTWVALDDFRIDNRIIAFDGCGRAQSLSLPKPPCYFIQARMAPLEDPELEAVCRLAGVEAAARLLAVRMK